MHRCKLYHPPIDGPALFRESGSAEDFRELSRSHRYRRRCVLLERHNSEMLAELRRLNEQLHAQKATILFLRRHMDKLRQNGGQY